MSKLKIYFQNARALNKRSLQLFWYVRVWSVTDGAQVYVLLWSDNPKWKNNSVNPNTQIYVESEVRKQDDNHELVWRAFEPNTPSGESNKAKLTPKQEVLELRWSGVRISDST